MWRTWGRRKGKEYNEEEKLWEAAFLLKKGKYYYSNYLLLHNRCDVTSRFRSSTVYTSERRGRIYCDSEDTWWAFKSSVKILLKAFSTLTVSKRKSLTMLWALWKILKQREEKRDCWWKLFYRSAKDEITQSRKPRCRHEKLTSSDLSAQLLNDK